jgi:hypothetical protein
MTPPPIVIVAPDPPRLDRAAGLLWMLAGMALAPVLLLIASPLLLRSTAPTQGPSTCPAAIQPRGGA